MRLNITITLLFFSIFSGLVLKANDWMQTSGPTTNFSSARAVDLNQDGIKDIVLGGGIESIFDQYDNIIQYSSNYMVVALDGSDGSYLWTVSGMDQVFGSPIFQDITGDTIPDVFIGGRNGYFLSIDGSNGAVIWEYYADAANTDASLYGIYNFYTAQWLPDVNLDGYKDILVSNGGDRKLPSWETNRPAGKLMVINSQDGSLIAEAEMPDGKETYMSPLIWDFFRDKKPDIIFGTGGETLGGNLFRVPLNDLLAGDISNATIIASSAYKGYIAVPTLADLTGDNIPEIIVSAYDGKISAINGYDNSEYWSYTLPNNETNASPIVGLFNNDSIPDVFAAYLEGVAPSYTGTVQLLFDGSNGQVIDQYNIGFIQYTTPLSYDYDSDGNDEVIYATNSIDAGNFYNDLRLIDFNNGTDSSLLTNKIGGNNIANTPWIGNLDNDGQLDLFYSHNLDSTSFVSEDGVAYRKITLSAPDTNHLAFACYLGTNMDGHYDNPVGTCFETIWTISTLAVSPTCIGDSDGAVDMDSNGCPCLFSQCQFSWNTGDSTHYSLNLPIGTYYGTIIHEDGCVLVVRTTIEDPESSSYSVIPESCSGSGDAIAGLFNADPFRTVINAIWPDGYNGVVNNNLSAGDYLVEVETEIAINDTLSNFCNETITVSVEPVEGFEIDFEFIDPLECGMNVSIEFSADSASSPIQYSIDGGLSYSYDSVISGLAPGIYDLLVLDASGCISSTSFTVPDLPEPLSYDLTLDNYELCDGITGNATIQINNGISPFENDLGIISNDGVFIYDDLENGMNFVSITDAQGCLLEFEIEITDPELLYVTFDTVNESVDGLSDGSISLDIVGGTAPYSIDWGDLSGNANGFEALNVGSGLYEIMVIDAFGCSQILEVSISFLLSDLEEFSSANQYVEEINKGVFLITSQIEISGYEIFSLAGERILFGNDNTIDISSKSSGVYYCVIRSGNQSWLQKISNLQ